MKADRSALLVQQNIPVVADWTPPYLQQTLNDLTELSLTSALSHPDAKIDLIVWPESPAPFFTNDAKFRIVISNVARATKSSIVTGSIGSEGAPGGAAQLFNSAALINPNGDWTARYDKVHLVPFGEYLPFEDVLERIGLQTLTEQRGGFLAGDRHRLIATPGAPSVLPLICYEIIFPGELASADERPGWIVNVTNDGWFGTSSGPYQHLQQARVTAIEEGVPVARAANTGISAVIDPVGRMVASLPLGSEGVLDTPLPRPIAAPVYARLGDAPATILISIALLAVLRGRFRTPMKKI